MRSSWATFAIVVLYLLHKVQSEELSLEPLKAMLNPECSSIFIINNQPFQRQSFAKELLGHTESGGYSVIEESSVNLALSSKLRKTCLCCYIIYFASSQKNPRSLLDKIKIRNSRVLLVDSSRPDNENFNHAMQDVALVVSGHRLSLVCPPDRTVGAKPLQRSLDLYLESSKSWRGHFDKSSRKPYKHCNPEGNFYSGRHMTASGSFEGISIFMGARRLGLQIAEALGASSIDLIFNRDAGLVTNLDNLRNDTIIGQVHGGLVDFATGVVMTDVSSSIVEPVRFEEGEFFFVTHKPQLLPKYQNISFPFGITVWMLFFASTAAMMIAMCVTYRAALAQKLEKFKKMYYFDVCFMAFGVALMEAHSEIFKKARLTKIGFSLRAVWLVCTMLLSMAYQGNLKASLTRKVYEKNPETNWELLDNEIPAYVVDVGYSEDYYMTHPNPFYTAMYKQTTKEETFVSRQDFSAMLMRVFEGELAYMQSSTGLDNIQRIIYAGKYGNKEYPLVRIKERYDIHDISFLVQRYLQQAEEISQAIRGLMENGIIEHDNEPAAVKSLQTSSGGEKLVVEHIVVALGILAASFAIALASILVECLVGRKSKRLAQHNFPLTQRLN